MADPILLHAPAGLDLGPNLLDALRAAYATPPRAYHDFSHVEEVTRRFAEAARESPWERPREAYVALLFHDAIYVAGAKDNEAKSAALAARLAPAGIDAARVAELILLTARHGSLTARDVDADAARFVDCDMAILAADPAAFAAYDAAIAKEYAFVPAEAYAAGRRAFFQRLLDAPRIYLSDWGYARFEARARANLSARLGA